MPRLFVFGIGGTGARVIKSLTMLLASGIKASNFEVVPILVDPHESLPELNNCKKVLKIYSDIHNTIFKDTTGIEEGYFITPITTLASVAPGTGIKEGFGLDGNYGMTFGQFIGRNNLPPDSKTSEFLSLLYSQNENFNKSLSVGFKGNPNVGSVVLNEIKNSQFFKAFETAFGKDDRIFIISSIFGGTGAAGFPLLLKNLKQHQNMMIRDAQIGALTVMPYFKLSSPDTDTENISDIDSKNFLTKTKSALTYYIKNINDLSALYYIADPDEQGKVYKNDETEQKNAAHLAEMLGALSVIHFCENSFSGPQEIFEYGLKENDSSIHFKNIGDETSKFIASPLTSFYLFSKLHSQIKERFNLPFRKTCGFNEKFFNDPFFSNLLEEFMHKHFNVWLKELSENQRSFNPFKMSDEYDFENLLIGYSNSRKTLAGIINKPFDLSDFYVNMAKEEGKYRNLNKTNNKNQYLSMARKAINKSITEHTLLK
jgi:hypothetical protein